MMTGRSQDEAVKVMRSDLRVRTLRLGTGTHFISFVTGSDASGPTFDDALERLLPSGDVVINLEGLGNDSARAVAAALRESGRAGDSRGRVIVVCEQANIRGLFRLWGLDRQVLIEHSLDDAFRYVLGRAWLASLAHAGGAPESARPEG